MKSNYNKYILFKPNLFAVYKFDIFVLITATQVNKKIASKGVRLGWTPMEDVVPLKLTPDLVKEKRLTRPASDQTVPGEPKNYLIP